MWSADVNGDRRLLASVILRTHRRPDGPRVAITSVLERTLDNPELIVIDDTWQHERCHVFDGGHTLGTP